jgi:hypothetical protein
MFWHMPATESSALAHLGVETEGRESAPVVNMSLFKLQVKQNIFLYL